MTVTTLPSSAGMPPAQPAELRRVQLVWLAAAMVVVSLGYGALMPLLPDWLTPMMSGATAAEIARHVGFLGGVYTAGVLIGALLWGVLSDRVGAGRILVIGLVGYVASLLLIVVPGLDGVWGIYTLRAATGFFVAAIVPVVLALVAQHTPEEKRARRFAWLGSMSLLGFLFGPGLSAVADWAGTWQGNGAVSVAVAAQIVIVVSALIGAAVMLGVTTTLPESGAHETGIHNNKPRRSSPRNNTALWLLSGAVMFVLAGFELGIVLQAKQQSGLSSRQAALMLAECSLVMLGINGLLFFTGLLEKIPARWLMAAGLILATVGLGLLALHRSHVWMYVGVSLTAAGTGLVLPVISFLAAGAAPQKLGAMMGSLAAAAAFGQTLGSSVGGWLLGALAQRAFGWLAVPLVAMFVLLFARPGWWSVAAAEPAGTADGSDAKVRSAPR